MRFYKKNTYYTKASGDTHFSPYVSKYRYNFDRGNWEYWITAEPSARYARYASLPDMWVLIDTKYLGRELEEYKEELITEEDYNKIILMYELDR